MRRERLDQRAALYSGADPRGSAGVVDRNVAQTAEIEHDPAVAQRRGLVAVTAAAQA